MRNISFNYLEFGQVVQEKMLFKDILNYVLSRALTALFRQSKTICAILVEGIMRNISIKLF